MPEKLHLFAEHILAALVVMFLTQLAAVVEGFRSGTSSESYIVYFLIGSGLGVVTFWVAIIVLPQVWPIAAGGG